jgi:hypothetical protein
MGCDYYIEKFLYIMFKDSYDTSYITLEINSGYFYDISLDEDDPKYNKEYKKMIHDCLSPSMIPILIYENDQFINEKLELKYKELIEKSIKNTNLNGIFQIWKKESRYERD